MAGDAGIPPSTCMVRRRRRLQSAHAHITCSASRRVQCRPSFRARSAQSPPGGQAGATLASRLLEWATVECVLSPPGAERTLLHRRPQQNSRPNLSSAVRLVADGTTSCRCLAGDHPQSRHHHALLAIFRIQSGIATSGPLDALPHCSQTRRCEPEGPGPGEPAQPPVHRPRRRMYGGDAPPTCYTACRPCRASAHRTARPPHPYRRAAQGGERGRLCWQAWAASPEPNVGSLPSLSLPPATRVRWACACMWLAAVRAACRTSGCDGGAGLVWAGVFADAQHPDRYRDLGWGLRIR